MANTRFVTFFIFAVVATLFGNAPAHAAAYRSSIIIRPALITSVTFSLPESAMAEAAVNDEAAVQVAHDQWLTGVAEAAAHFGCSPKLVQQLPTESVAEVVKLFAMTAEKGTCLVLLPISTDPKYQRYSFASGGQIDGTNILYISDVGRARIWNGTPVAGD